MHSRATVSHMWDEAAGYRPLVSLGKNLMLLRSTRARVWEPCSDAGRDTTVLKRVGIRGS